MEFYKRWMESSVRTSLKTWRAVSIVGARQCGKTTLGQSLPSKTMIARSLDNSMFLQSALEDPESFVRHDDGTTLFIDEIQKAPSLLPAIKGQVDRTNATGQFLLTGSANLHTLPDVTESLAGRLHSVRLRTLAEGEIRGTNPNFPAMAFSGDLPAHIDGCDKQQILALAFRGGYPEAVRVGTSKRGTWHRDYIDHLLRHDIQDVAEIRKLDKLRAVFTFLAARSSKLWNISEIATSLEITKASVENYVAALESLYLFDRVEAWTSRDYERTLKRPKWFIGDTGLMCAHLKWHPDDIAFDSDRCGKLVESWVYHELASALDTIDGYSIFHYRDREQREIDFILENDDGALVGIEVKSGALVNTDDFSHMEWFRRNLGGERWKQSIVLYSGPDTLSFGKGKLAVPLFSLFV